MSRPVRRLVRPIARGLGPKRELADRVDLVARPVQGARVAPRRADLAQVGQAVADLVLADLAEEPRELVVVDPAARVAEALELVVADRAAPVDRVVAVAADETSIRPRSSPDSTPTAMAKSRRMKCRAFPSSSAVG